MKSAATKSPRSTFAIVKTLGGAAADVTFTDTTKAYHEVGLKIGGEGYASGAFVRTSQDHTVSATATVGPSQFKRIRGKWLWFRWNLKCATYGGAYETLVGYGESRADSWSGELEPFGGAKTDPGGIGHALPGGRSMHRTTSHTPSRPEPSRHSTPMSRCSGQTSTSSTDTNARRRRPSPIASSTERGICVDTMPTHRSHARRSPRRTAP